MPTIQITGDTNMVLNPKLDLYNEARKKAANLYNDVSYLWETSRNTAHVMEDGVTSFGGDSHRSSTAGNTKRE